MRSRPGDEGAARAMRGIDRPRVSDSVPASTRAAGAIVIARHGEPALSRHGRLDWREYEQWWAAYDAAGLEPGQAPPDALIAEAEKAQRILSSPIRRARETADAVAPGRRIEVDPDFVEAPLPPPRYPRFIKMAPSSFGWGWHARVFWWLGFHRGQESRSAAEARARVAAAKLIAIAEGGETVVVFAHGWFNRMLRPALQSQGWRCVCDGKDFYWSHRRYEKAGQRR